MPHDGRGARVKRRSYPAGDFWHVVDVRPTKPQMHAVLGTSHAGAPEAAAPDDAHNAQHAAQSEADGTAGDGNHSEATSGQQIGTADGDSDGSSAAQGQQAEYVGPSGFKVRHRKYSAHVYGIRYRGDAPEAAVVRRLPHTYKHDWVLHADNAAHL